MELTVRVPGSCGELLQGMKAGNPFLVTCPVGSYTTVRISDTLAGIHGLGRKSLMALEKTLTSLGKSARVVAVTVISAVVTPPTRIS